MVAPVLTDYQYQFKDTGMLLNGDNTLPFIDIKKVTGLGMTEFEAHIDELDGDHGGLVTVRYAKQRTIILEGDVYASPTTIQTTLDALTANFLPDDIEYPFYFKQPGPAQRYVNAKAVALHIEEDQLRRIGSSPIQIQLIGPKPEKRVDNALATRGGGSWGDASIPNTGNAYAYPKYTVVGPFSTFKMAYTGTNAFLLITYGASSSDTFVIDFRAKMITLNGTVANGLITSGGFWGAEPGSNFAATFEYTGGPPTSATLASYSAWL